MKPAIGRGPRPLELGHRPGLDVVAKGVEGDRTALRLTEFEVDLLQGYLFSQPLGETVLADHLTAERAAQYDVERRLDRPAGSKRIVALHRYEILDDGLDDIT